MRILAVALAAMLLGSGCGGGKKMTFTNGNYQTLVHHPAKYDGAHVDAKHASQVTLIDVPTGAADLSERQLVHVRLSDDRRSAVSKPLDDRRVRRRAPAEKTGGARSAE